MAIYSASKFAVEGLTEGLRLELARDGVTVKLIEPGYVPATGIGATLRKNSSNIPVPPPYQAHVDAITSVFTGPAPADAATARDVASTMLAAALDETDMLRFTVGKDAALAAHMRRDAGEVEYLSWAAARFST